MRAADLTTALILIAGGALVIWDSLRIGIGFGGSGRGIEDGHERLLVADGDGSG